MDQINIVIVDDHKIVRDGIRAILIGIPDIKIVEEASNFKELREKLQKIIPDILFIDISLPETSGIEIAKIIKRDYPYIKIAMISADANEHSIIEAVKAGALSYIHKDISKEEFIKAIYAIYKGEEYFSTSILPTVYKSFTKTIKGGDKYLHTMVDNLTDREIEIIKLFTEGLTYKEIADRLNISVRTVETHKNNIMSKLELTTIIDLVKFAIKNRIIEIL